MISELPNTFTSVEQQQHLLDFLIRHPLAQDVFSQELFTQLKPVGHVASIIREMNLPIDENEIYTFGNHFDFKNNEGSSIAVRYSFYRQKKANESLPRLVMIYLLYNKDAGDVVAYCVQTIYRHQSGDLVSKLDFLKRLPRAAEAVGFSDYFMQYNHHVLQRFNVKRMSIDCGWLGRQIWAQKGYDFDPQISVIYNGKKITQAEAAQNNFSHFMARNNLQLGDLMLKDTSQGAKTIRSIKELNQPIDFVNIIHRDGKKLAIRPCIDHLCYDSVRELDIGKAFVLGQYYPQHTGQLNTVIHPEYPEITFTDDALIVWSACRSFDSNSHWGANLNPKNTILSQSVPQIE